MLTLDTKIKEIKKVGPSYLKRLHQLKIKTIRGLFFHFPHRYDDFSQIVSISQLKEGQKATIKGEIVEIENTRLFHKRMVLTEALVKDKSGAIKVVWFNQPYLTQTLKKGKIVNLSGKLSFVKKTLCLSNPVYEITKGQSLRDSPSKKDCPLGTVPYASYTHTGRLVPIYHETAGLSSRYLRYLIKPLLPLADKIADFLPDLIKKEFSLVNLNQAIKQIHFPDNSLSAQKARQRLAFDEIFLIHLTTLKQKQKLNQEKALAIPFEEKLIKSFVRKLPFKLTNDQRIAAWQIFQDLAKKKPMNRLLNGDVGSGKTVVAIMAGLEIAKDGYQVALMAPTEILAKQHFQTFKDFLKKSNLKIALLTRTESLKDCPLGTVPKGQSLSRPQLKKQISDGKIDIIIGTHALIQENLNFKNLALAIVDEQHRFGVAQRANLQRKIYQVEDGLPTIPHLLSMTATPIPRTLTLTIYGDLDISILREMPKGRQKTITKIVVPTDRQKTYNFIKKQVKQKKQVFVICPLIDESEKLEVKSVTQEYEKLSKKVFPQLKIALLHGKLKAKEKEEIMKKFKQGKTDILVSTSVVEVGIDVPNATVMMIEGADRFGLAQLHQFRGRIGRGPAQSYCFLFTDSMAKKTHQRLKAVLKAKDGFELAEKDLKIRGPGDFTGVRQWGLPDLTMASLNDLELIQKTRLAAQQVLEKNLFNSVLEKKLKQFQKIVHLE
ncbi:MAG: ATP-dependent DNA helicase RecG [Candidatus Portnoybacteria bacterium]|nr:ATP-dependent DNA helicase RecG [Candidatus Portnoybacteria bacterium]